MRNAITIIITLCMAFSMTACAVLETLDKAPAPVELADKTMVDEQAMLGIELAYKAARLAAETAVDAQLVRGENAARLAELDARAFQAVEIARRAYRAGNAPGFVTALGDAQGAVRDLLALANGKGA
jgi:hypothetical protein